MPRDALNILLTNDDGVAAPGIWAAAGVVSRLGRITVVAPATNHSGYGAALPPTPGHTYFPYRPDAGLPANVAAYGLEAPPACCAQVGLSGVLGGGPFDLVVSGVNLGANLGRDVFYSGTVGAALTAHLLGVPAIAVSLDAADAETAHWETAAWALGEVIRLWLAHPTRREAFYNVNAPNLPLTQVKGALFAIPANDTCVDKYAFDRHPHVDGILISRRKDEPAQEPAPHTDAWAVGQGYVAVSPLRAMSDLLCATFWSMPALRHAAAPPAFSAAAMSSRVEEPAMLFPKSPSEKKEELCLPVSFS
jgi:5'-nucleotidase